MDQPEGAVAAQDNEDSEYEYEYDPFEAETFYINLELSSANGLIRPPRKRSSTMPTDSPIDPALNASLDGDGQHYNTDQELESQSRVQIMDLHTSNPIVSYGNQIFSCSWADMIGTELMFSRAPERLPNSLPPLWRHEDDCELLCANRVRVVGQKANLISSSGGGQNVLGNDPAEASRVAASNQARFLARLAKAKHAKGETDMIRTVFPLRKNQNLEGKIEGWNRTEAAVAEVERLNKLALEGDADALHALERIYSQRSGQGSYQGSRGSGVQTESTTPTPSEPPPAGS
ncbi:uncharacterized protein GIQ15_03575 [Arthroderma uncinatum]|uniref:uncharacterized protein n=1 Tax=Arthroderma uncinatum TaxID=74035 RepID=UPI00144A9DE5|nr:uncharacterized protein GIQ15_03575 [Arthroderma uncinatum]KAF3484251.1 hypothetical protein GIQ15_03575 [Arthroderma uncinatum]